MTRWFWSTTSYNRFFQDTQVGDPKAYVVIEARPVPYFFGLLVGLMVTDTKQLDPGEEQDFQEVTREIEFAMADRRLKRAKAKEEQEAVQKAATAEQARLALVGQKYENRTKHMKTMPPGDQERKDMEALLNAGDPEILYGSKLEAYTAGYNLGYQTVKEATK
jgi:hypothetical protein